MHDKLPEIYWYLFWVLVVCGLIAFGLYTATIEHRRNMKALDILKAYAEKGTTPPAGIADQLAGQILDSRRTAEPRRSIYERRSALLRIFVGSAFAACLAWGLALWLTDSGGAKWAVYAAQGAESFFGFVAFGMFVAALLTREK